MFGFHIIRERWKFNKEYGIYVSSLGRFKDENKKEIFPSPQHRYLALPVRNKILLAHVAVLKTFKGDEYKEGDTVDHIDHNTRNNSLSNLRWIPREENCNDSLVEEHINHIKDIGVYEYLKGIRAAPTNIGRQARRAVSKKIQESGLNGIYSISWDLKGIKYDNIDFGTAVGIIANTTGANVNNVKKDLKNFTMAGLTKRKKYGFDITIDQITRLKQQMEG